MPKGLGAGTYEQGLAIIGTRLEDHKPGEPKIVIALAMPDEMHEQDCAKAFDYLYTSNDAWDKVTEKRLRAYGWDAEAHSFNLAELNDPNNALIGSVVAPVTLKEEEYVKDGVAKTSVKVYRVGDEKFGNQVGDEEAKLITKSFQDRMRLRQAAKGRAAVNALPSAPAAPPVKANGAEDTPF